MKLSGFTSLMPSFNPRARAGRDMKLSGFTSLMPSFNPRARAGRDLCTREVQRSIAVSIHAPARGATCSIFPMELRCWVSIHAPARGATRQSCGKRKEGVFQSTRPRGARLGSHVGRERRECFNPRARAGRDVRPGKYGAVCGVSIHAPARGATIPMPKTRSVKIVSIHAPARGATALRLFVIRIAGVSIHAPARGATGANGKGYPSESRFNPRARAGRDILCIFGASSANVSIHAPARGATSHAHT